MKYEVLVDFTDKETKHIYRQGDKYPEKGRTKKARIDELLSAENLRKQPLIKVIEDVKADE
ncbi:MAG: hypothetical protein LKF42_09560 [Streptococcaceae bacterium]|jgi:hypothetical protein|nr:hypothetical protein [Streptococcaceae bacterium]MCH4178109.1 hypothetical protein [Streptococcaceae bacterium]